MEEVYEFGRRLQADGHFAEAEKCYRRYLDDHADSHRALNNLGVVLECQERIDEAIPCFEKAVQLSPQSAIPLYNLGHALYQHNRLLDASKTFQQLLSKHADHGPARLNLGIIQWRQDRRESAIETLRLACKSDDVAARAHGKLGELLFEDGRYSDARAEYQQAAERDDLATYHFHTAVCDNLLNNTQGAVEGFARALSKDPASTLLHEHHVRALLKIGDNSSIERAFAAWQTAVPNDPVCEHMQAAFRQDSQLTRCSKEYVRETFSAFAVDFDSTLEKLNYHAPSKIAEYIKSIADDLNAFPCVLDAGCGTGLCGPKIRPLATKLIGVDLAEPMLAQAHITSAYDQLIEADLVDYLTDSATPQFDVIFAADTFNYFGELDELIYAAHARLVHAGHLIFTLEQSDTASEAYRLMEHGRFEHSRHYVQSVLQAHGLETQVFDSFVLRKESGKNVDGWLIHATRK